MKLSDESGDQKNREFQASKAALAAIVSFRKRNSNGWQR